MNPELYRGMSLDEVFNGLKALSMATKAMSKPLCLYFDEADTVPSTGYLLEQKLKNTKGKGQRKIRRQLKRWLQNKFLLSHEEIEECQKKKNN